MMHTSARAALSLLCLLSFACGDDEEDQERRLVLFHTNDEHSHLFGFAPELDDFPLPTEPGDGAIVGNIARRAEKLAEERAALADEDIDSLTVSAGDQTQGALPQIAFADTSPDFALMAELGYDVMCPGNHEFDLGPDAYAAAIEAVPDMPPIVSTNIRFSDEEGDDALQALYGDGGSTAPITPYQIIETASGLRVGFVGIMGVSAAFFAPTKAPVEFSGNLADEGDQEAILPALYNDIQPAVDALRDEGVDVVVALSHSGVNTDDPELGDDFNIAQNVEGIDIIVSGHTHTALQEPVIAEGPDGHQVPIVQAGSYGRFLGRVELVIPAPGERPELDSDSDRTLLIPIDDTIVPTDESILGQLDDLIADLEADVLPEQLSLIEGAEVIDDPDVLGDLYYRRMGATDFDIIGLRSRVETNMLNLSTDSMLAAADEFAVLEEGEPPTQIAIEASGTVRDDILVGETGTLSYADLYRVFPLGENPLDGSIGYPLSRFYVSLYELKAALEVGVSQGYVDDSLFLSASGIRVEYDTSREPQDTTNLTDVFIPENGRVTKIILDVDGSDTFDDNDIAIFDLTRGADAWDSEQGDEFSLYSIVTSLYIASFADTAGVTLKDFDGNPIDFFDTILRRPDATEVKAYEAFISFVSLLSALNNGTLPEQYDEKSAAGATPRHMICTGPLCL